MARRGARVTAVEARPANVAKIEVLRDHFELTDLEIQQADVKDVVADAAPGAFDIVLALGILYHLDEPVPWLQRLGEVASRVLVLDTHVAPADEAGMEQLRPDLRHLSGLHLQLVHGATYEGRWFNEFPSTITDASREAQLWASWSNDRSFWLTEEALLQALRSAGFDLLYEQHDLTAGRYRTFKTEFPRVMYVCAHTDQLTGRAS
jgi:hypothetical protein